MSDVIYAMSNFFSQKLIKLSGKMQKEHFITTVSILLYKQIFKEKHNWNLRY